jgi:hypothetical protein
MTKCFNTRLKIERVFLRLDQFLPFLDIDIRYLAFLHQNPTMIIHLHKGARNRDIQYLNPLIRRRIEKSNHISPTHNSPEKLVFLPVRVRC